MAAATVYDNDGDVATATAVPVTATTTMEQCLLPFHQPIHPLRRGRKPRRRPSSG